jgi:mannosyl-3-phosphoglycerate phosphatase
MVKSTAKENPPLIIFTDLDGTLLDHYSYSFDAAQEVLKKINVAKISLIFYSSKTRAEIEMRQKKLGNHYPFISENGGAIFYFKKEKYPNAYQVRTRNGYRMLKLGTNYPDLLKQFKS